MKKKCIITLVILLAFSNAVFSYGMGVSGQVSPLGFMNFSVWTKYNTNNFPELLKNKENELSNKVGGGKLVAKDKFLKESYNAYCLGLDLRFSYAYMTLNFGFPTTMVSHGRDPLNSFLKNNDKAPVFKGGSIIFNGHLGAGYTLFESSPLNIFAGAGLSFDIIKTTRVIGKGILTNDEWREVRTLGLLGLGANVGVSYYFINNVGIFGGITDSFSFAQLLNQRYYDSDDYTFYINSRTNDNKDGDKSVKDLVSLVLANNFVIRLGVALRL